LNLNRLETRGRCGNRQYRGIGQTSSAEFPEEDQASKKAAIKSATGAAVSSLQTEFSQARNAWNVERNGITQIFSKNQKSPERGLWLISKNYNKVTMLASTITSAKPPNQDCEIQYAPHILARNCLHFHLTCSSLTTKLLIFSSNIRSRNGPATTTTNDPSSAV